MKLKVLYTTNIPSPYMVDYFNELGKLCELTVIFEKRVSDERDKSWKEFNFQNFNGIILNGISTAADKAFCPHIVKYIGKAKFDHIIVTNPATPTGIIAIEYMKLRNIPFILESEGGFAKNGKGFKERFKKHLMSGAKLYFSTTPIGDEYFLTYGATKERIAKYPFTSLYKKDILDSVVSKMNKRIIKKKIGISEEKIILSVGRFINTKGFDVLLKACKMIDKNIGVYIIGGEPTEEYLELKNKLNLTNVHFVGFKTKEELSKYYKAADLFVLATREDVWGLVINEAMAFGLPIITTDKCIAGLELVKDFENGFIVPVGDDVNLAEKINDILEDEDLRQSMSQKSLEKIQWYTFESMAETHIEVLKEIKYD